MAWTTRKRSSASGAYDDEGNAAAAAAAAGHGDSPTKRQKHDVREGRHNSLSSHWDKKASLSRMQASHWEELERQVCCWKS